jgi:hypothetical protein
MAKDSRLTRLGLDKYNQPKRTPNHPTKSHVVVAKEGDEIKRHAENIKKGKMSGAYWANKVKW